MDKKKSLKKTLRIFIVEDHPIFRKGLIQLLNNEHDMEVCGEAEDDIEGLEGIKKEKPDFVIVDISLKESSGIELIKNIKLYFPDLPVLALSMHDENIYAERVLRAGAKGYLMKQEAPEIIIDAIGQIIHGKIYISENMSARMLHRIADGQNPSESSPVNLLSDRELEVYRLIGKGSSTREIAQQLHISIKTVENHKAHIKEKLTINNSIELIQQATLWIKSEGEV